MKRLLAALFLASLSAFPAMADTFGGTYDVKGTNLDGSSYEGTVEITLTSDTTCTIHWETGGNSSNGICSRNGDAFAAAYVLDDAVGLIVYRVTGNGALDGLWTIAGQNGNGTEVLTPQ